MEVINLAEQQSSEFDANEALQKLSDWGRQTILSTFSVINREGGKDTDPIDAYNEMDLLAQQLWEAAFNECPKPVQPNDILFHFSRRVLNWSADRRGFKRQEKSE
jgi:hypothetical protein